MGVNYSSHIAIGYLVDEDDLLSFVDIQTLKEPTTRYEPRYCPKTGKQLKNKKVVDPGVYKSTFIPDGRDCDEHDLYGLELAEAIAKHLNCKVWITNHNDEDEYIFGPKIAQHQKGEDWGRFDFGPNYTFQAVIDAQPHLEKLGALLEKAGIEVGEPLIVNAVWVG